MSDFDSGDILRLGALLIYDGLYDIVNVWHVRAGATSGQDWAAVTTMVQAWLDGVYDEMKATLSDEIATGSVSVANVTQDTTLGSILWSPTWGGADAGDPTAAGVCAFAWGRTHKPRVQIRKYFGVFGKANVVVGSWSAAVQVDVEAAMTYAITTRSSGQFTDIQAVAYNRLLASYETAYSVESSAEPAYQRRRKRGRGS